MQTKIFTGELRIGIGKSLFYGGQQNTFVLQNPMIKTGPLQDSEKYTGYRNPAPW